MRVLFIIFGFILGYLLIRYLFKSNPYQTARAQMVEIFRYNRGDLDVFCREQKISFSHLCKCTWNLSDEAIELIFGQDLKNPQDQVECLKKVDEMNNEMTLELAELADQYFHTRHRYASRQILRLIKTFNFKIQLENYRFNHFVKTGKVLKYE